MLCVQLRTENPYIIREQMSKYYVRACPNCKHLNKKTGKCKEGNDTINEYWMEQYGRVPQRLWTPEMDVECYEDNAKMLEMKDNKAMIDDFMSQLSAFKPIKETK